jgi:hypothetical protein
MEVNFKFSLQDLVTLKSVLFETEGRFKAVGKIDFLAPGQVVQRIADECSAGVQCSYMVNLNGGKMIVHEDQLVPATELIDLWFKLMDSNKVAKLPNQP